MFLLFVTFTLTNTRSFIYNYIDLRVFSLSLWATGTTNVETPLCSSAEHIFRGHLCHLPSAALRARTDALLDVLKRRLDRINTA